MGKVKGHRPADLWAWPVAFILAKALAPETGWGRERGQGQTQLQEGKEGMWGRVRLGEKCDRRGEGTA